jgi:hypothetical protein
MSYLTLEAMRKTMDSYMAAIEQIAALGVSVDKLFETTEAWNKLTPDRFEVNCGFERALPVANSVYVNMASPNTLFNFGRAQPAADVLAKGAWKQIIVHIGLQLWVNNYHYSLARQHDEETDEDGEIIQEAYFEPARLEAHSVAIVCKLHGFGFTVKDFLTDYERVYNRLDGASEKLVADYHKQIEDQNILVKRWAAAIKKQRAAERDLLDDIDDVDNIPVITDLSNE